MEIGIIPIMAPKSSITSRGTMGVTKTPYITKKTMPTSALHHATCGKKGERAHVQLTISKDIHPGWTECQAAQVW